MPVGAQTSAVSPHTCLAHSQPSTAARTWLLPGAGRRDPAGGRASAVGQSQPPACLAERRRSTAGPRPGSGAGSWGRLASGWPVWSCPRGGPRRVPGAVRSRRRARVIPARGPQRPFGKGQGCALRRARSSARASCRRSLRTEPRAARGAAVAVLTHSGHAAPLLQSRGDGVLPQARAELAVRVRALRHCWPQSRPCGRTGPDRGWAHRVCGWCHPDSGRWPPRPGELKRGAVSRAAGAGAAPASASAMPGGPGPLRPSMCSAGVGGHPTGGACVPRCSRLCPGCLPGSAEHGDGRRLPETHPAPSARPLPVSDSVAWRWGLSHPALAPSLPCAPSPRASLGRGSLRADRRPLFPSLPQGHHLARRRGQGRADGPAAVRLRGRGPHQARPLPGRHGRAALHGVQR